MKPRTRQNEASRTWVKETWNPGETKPGTSGKRSLELFPRQVKPRSGKLSLEPVEFTPTIEPGQMNPRSLELRL
jgi:hypothetical protein